MIDVGENSGQLEKVFKQLSESQELDLEEKMAQVLAFAQPIILIVMGLLIGFILIAILLPLTDLSSITNS